MNWLTGFEKNSMIDADDFMEEQIYEQYFRL